MVRLLTRLSLRPRPRGDACQDHVRSSWAESNGSVRTREGVTLEQHLIPGRRARMEAMDRRFQEEREARRRQWAERREEWIARRDHDDRLPAERDTDRRAMAAAARDEVLFQRDAFAGPY